MVAVPYTRTTGKLLSTSRSFKLFQYFRNTNSHLKQTYNMKQYSAGERMTLSLGISDGEKDLGVLADSEVKFSKRVEAQVNNNKRTQM